MLEFIANVLFSMMHFPLQQCFITNTLEDGKRWIPIGTVIFHLANYLFRLEWKTQWKDRYKKSNLTWRVSFLEICDLNGI